MQKQDLIPAYHKRLEFYQKKFNHDRVFPFIEIKIKEGREKKFSFKNFHDMFLYDSILILSTHDEISEEIIDFAAVLSFIPSNFRSKHLSGLLFLLHFKNYENTKIKDLWNETNRYVSDTMIKIVLNDRNLRFYQEEITITDLLFEFTAKIKPFLTEEVFFAVFLNWLRVIYNKKINIGTLREILSISSDLHTFDDYLDANMKSFQNFRISVYFLMRNYPKIGLNQYLIYIKFVNIKKSQANLEKYLFKVPFFSHFMLINNICQMIGFIPFRFEHIFTKYLKQLQKSRIIDLLYINRVTESDFKLQFDNKLTRDQNIHEILPFLSKKFRSNKFLSPKLKKFPEFALVKHHQNFSKKIYQIESNFDALDFFIFFNIENLLNRKESIYELIKKNKLISCLGDLNSKQIRKSYDLLFSDNLFPTDNIPIEKFINSINEKYPKKKSIERLMAMFNILKIADTSELTRDFFERQLLKIGNEFNKFFLKRANHSMAEVKFRFDRLIKKEYLKTYIDTSYFMHKHHTSIFLEIATVAPLEFTKCFMEQNVWKSKTLIRYTFSVIIDMFLFFMKNFLQENLISIGIPYIFTSSNFGFDIVSFFDFEKHDWDKAKIKKCFLTLQKEFKNEKKNPTIKADLSKWQEDLYVFRPNDFFTDLRYFNNLNEISKNANLNREKIIGFFKNYYQEKYPDFSIISDNFDYVLIPEKFIDLEKKKGIFVIISQSGTNINPSILKKNPEFSILFSEHLQNGWYWGGSMDNILILEYIIKIENLKNDKSKWNIDINNIISKYPDLKLKIYEIKEDLRFFGERSLYPLSWYYDDYNYLKQSINMDTSALEVKEEISFLFDSEFPCKEYHPQFLPWEFWHVIGYPISVSIIAECSQDESKKVKMLIKRLPAGQIFTFKKFNNDNKIILLAIVQLRNNIDRFFENIIPALNDLECEYYMSLIVPLSLWGGKYF